MRKKMLLFIALGIGVLSCKKYDALGNEIRFEELNKASFLLGNWDLRDSLGVLQMQWNVENDSTFSGLAYFIKGEKSDTLHREVMELQQRDKYLVYTSTVSGEKGETSIPFQLTKDADSCIVFENPKNDYPSKIEFYLQKNGLVKQTEIGKILKKGKTQSYTWTKTTPKKGPNNKIQK